MSSLKVVVFGAGSIGCYVGGHLASQGVSVRFVGRERFQRDLSQHGLTLTHYEREPIKVAPGDFKFSLQAGDLSDTDIVLVTVKSQDSKLAGSSIATSISANALVVSLQNGTGNAATLQSQLPTTTVLGGMVPFNVTSTGPGQFHCGTEGDLIIQSHNAAALNAMQAAFAQAGQPLQLVDNIKETQWGKLLVNLNNALNALAGGTLKAGLMQRDYRRALALMIEEALGIVRSADIEPAKFGNASAEKMIRVLRLPNLVYKIIMNTIVRIDANARSSMLDDLEAGRAPEVDYLQGEIVRLAASIGKRAPINAHVLAMVNDAFDKGKSPKLSGARMLKALNARTNN